MYEDMLTFCKHRQYFSCGLCEFLRVLCIACGTCHLLDIVGIASCLNELESNGEWFLHLYMLQKMCTTGIHAQVNVSEEVAHVFLASHFSGVQCFHSGVW